MISFEDFTKLEIKIGTIIAADHIAGTDHLLRLDVDLGNEVRQIVTGMAAFFNPAYFLAKQVPVLVNLAPRKIRGIESQGMILAADVDGQPVLLHPHSTVPTGSRVR